ncbi:hypothetical protein [Thiohalophilus thiocyanatoxydans]|uniref:Cytoplasmic protein n=1 Tax=Thiohalophilus thiocyanatoxydans TaxID=381308 RepID=A0A4V3H3F2_9GAMM|nr:hypothetical protein [Thiohalophilus thiocyanatoxydans]TDX98133.1 hypothetical protein EDC23_2615 [Thiohalophilus thiocyanatoxydans]
MSEQSIDIENLRMNTDDLYREEVFTDQRVGTLRRLTPVTSDGSDDASRSVRYLGQSQMMTPMGALPLNFEIEADSLEQALDKYADAAKQAVEQALEELKEMRREAASQIVVPEAGGTGGGMGGPGDMGGGPGGFPGGGGGFKLP